MHPQSLPTGLVHGWTQREGGMGLPGQPRASQQHVPISPGVPGRVAGCSCPVPGRGTPSLAAGASTGGRMAASRELLATNCLRARKDKKLKPPPLNAKPEQQIWCEAPLWEMLCALSRAFKHAGSCRSWLLCEWAVGWGGQGPANPLGWAEPCSLRAAGSWTARTVGYELHCSYLGAPRSGRLPAAARGLLLRLSSNRTPLKERTYFPRHLLLHMQGEKRVY